MNERNRDSDRDSVNAGFLIGLLASTAIGAGLALLLAPKAGELRARQSERGEGRLSHRARRCVVSEPRRFPFTVRRHLPDVSLHVAS
jgi:hypothetical protein